MGFKRKGYRYTFGVGASPDLPQSQVPAIESDAEVVDIGHYEFTARVYDSPQEPERHAAGQKYYKFSFDLPYGAWAEIAAVAVDRSGRKSKPTSIHFSVDGMREILRPGAPTTWLRVLSVEELEYNLLSVLGRNLPATAPWVTVNPDKAQLLHQDLRPDAVARLTDITLPMLTDAFAHLAFPAWATKSGNTFVMPVRWNDVSGFLWGVYDVDGEWSKADEFLAKYAATIPSGAQS